MLFVTLLPFLEYFTCVSLPLWLVPVFFNSFVSLLPELDRAAVTYSVSLNSHICIVWAIITPGRFSVHISIWPGNLSLPSFMEEETASMRGKGIGFRS